MKFTCNVKSLNNALSIVTHSLPVRTPKPILEGILLEASSGMLKLTCMDNSMSIETSISAEIEESGAVVMPGKLFADIARKLPSEECLISTNDRFQGHIKSEFFKTTIAGMNPIEYPEFTNVIGSSFEIEESKLKRMIDGTIFAVAVDESRPILTGCLFEIEDGLFNLVALDGFRMGVCREHLSYSDKKISAVVSGKMVSDIGKIIGNTDEMLQVCVGRNHMCITKDETRINMLLMEGEYIRYSQIIPSEWKTRVNVSKSRFADAIDRASLILRDTKINLVHLHIENDNIQISSNSEKNEMEENVNAEMYGDALDIAFNIRYLSDIIKAVDDDVISMHFNSPVSPCVINPVEEDSDKYTYLVLPVRINDI